MEYLRSFKYPLASMINEGDDVSMHFIEHTAEQTIISAKAGSPINRDVCEMLNRAGAAMIKTAAITPVTDDQARLFEKIMSAVHLSAQILDDVDESSPCNTEVTGNV